MPTLNAADLFEKWNSESSQSFLSSSFVILLSTALYHSNEAGFHSSLKNNKIFDSFKMF